MTSERDDLTELESDVVFLPPMAASRLYRFIQELRRLRLQVKTLEACLKQAQDAGIDLAAQLNAREDHGEQ